MENLCFKSMGSSFLTTLQQTFVYAKETRLCSDIRELSFNDIKDCAVEQINMHGLMPELSGLSDDDVDNLCTLIDLIDFDMIRLFDKIK